MKWKTMNMQTEKSNDDYSCNFKFLSFVSPLQFIVV